MFRFLSKLGPGLIFAAAAIGVSHIAQSTRAGASYGLALIVFIVGANLMKYPAFRFGPHYAAATGQSLLQGYRNRGMWALVVYAVLTLATMFGVQAAVTLVTAGVFKAWTGVDASPLALSVGLLVACAIILGVGRYRWLDRIVKVLVSILTLATIAATISVVPLIEWSQWSLLLAPEQLDVPTLLFIAALIGWMPSAIDISVWNSLWTLAKSDEDGAPPELSGTITDFHVGYVGTAVLAVCFALLGAGAMHGRGLQFEEAPGRFAAQVIELYATTLGDWSRPIIGVCAFAVMFSTTLAVLDGFPRAIGVLMTRFRRDETLEDATLRDPLARRSFWGALFVLAVGSSIVIAALQSSLKAMVDLATTLSFLTAPLLAYLNHRAVMGDEVPEASRPAPWLRHWSVVAIVLMAAFAAFWAFLKLSATGA